MHAKIISATTIGVDASLVDVEVDLSFGMLIFNIVGLPDMAIKESRQRIHTALKNCGFGLPERKITVNLAPADLKKEGTLFDLPIALGILHAASELTIPQSFFEETVFLGELSLDGAIRPARGVLAIAFDAHRLGKKRIVLPQANAAEAALIEGLEVIGVDHLTTLVSFLRGERVIAPTPRTIPGITSRTPADFSDIKGQRLAKRALQIAAAGRHNILFIGSPGSGKTLLARRLPMIMPSLSFSQMLETTKIYSVSGNLGTQTLITERPFRAPHHTISQAGLVGGGSFPQPGEITLAHHGILFLDELTEFRRTTLESLRQPLESKTVSIARAQQTVTFPANCQIVAALNPCPCGFYGDAHRACRCSDLQVSRYLEKLSGPFLDRIDLQVGVTSVPFEAATSTVPTESTHQMEAQIAAAVARQKIRFGTSERSNTDITAQEIDELCPITPEARELVHKAFNKLGLSMRGYHKLLKLSRTIADLDDADQITDVHVREASMYRSLDQALERRGA